MATIFYISALEDGKLRVTHGRYLHSCFFTLMGNVSPELATKLHKSNQERPFTVSTLYPCKNIHFKPDKYNQMITIRKGEKYWFRITGMTAEICDVINQICGNNKPMIRIDTVSFDIFQTDQKKHSRAGSFKYEDIGNFLNHPPPHTYSLQFISPTAFHSRNQNIVFPMPVLVFPRLLKRWNRFCPEKWQISEDLTHDQFEEWVMVSGYKLQTHSLDFGPKGRELTFSGYCEYKASRNAPFRVKQILHVLLRFSFFAGIGYGTPKGMGQVDFLTFNR